MNCSRIKDISIKSKYRVCAPAGAPEPCGWPAGIGIDVQRLSFPAAREFAVEGRARPIQCGRRCSIHASTRLVARRSGGMSSASKTRPSGNIHRPKIGRILRNPPIISSIPAGMRSQRADGCRSQRNVRWIRVAIAGPAVRGAVPAPHRSCYCGCPPALRLIDGRSTFGSCVSVLLAEGRMGRTAEG